MFLSTGDSSLQNDTGQKLRGQQGHYVGILRLSFTASISSREDRKGEASSIGIITTPCDHDLGVEVAKVGMVFEGSSDSHSVRSHSVRESLRFDQPQPLPTDCCKMTTHHDKYMKYNLAAAIILETVNTAALLPGLLMGGTSHVTKFCCTGVHRHATLSDSLGLSTTGLGRLQWVFEAPTTYLSFVSMSSDDEASSQARLRLDTLTRTSVLGLRTPAALIWPGNSHSSASAGSTSQFRRTLATKYRDNLSTRTRPLHIEIPAPYGRKVFWSTV